MTLEQQRLVEDNIGLVGKTIQKYFPELAWDDDIYQIGCEGLIKAAIRFDPTISKISTYGVSCIRTSIANHIECQYRQCRKANNTTLSLEEPVGEDLKTTLKDFIEHPIDYIGSIIENDVIDRALEKLTKKELEVVKLVILDVGTQEDIVNILGISQATVSRRLRSARNKLKGLVA